MIYALYDRECRFCRAALGALLVWDRRRRLRPLPLQDELASELLGGMDLDERLRTARAIPAGAPPAAASSGAQAFARMAEELPGGSPLGSLLTRFPGAAQSAYDWVSDHRSQLIRLVPDRAIDAATRLIDERERAADGLRPTPGQAQPSRRSA